MKPAAKAQANTQAPPTETPRPTITLQSVMVTGPDTAAFSGWGPKVTGVGNILKNWN
jgi:hypothetical protein